MEMLTVFILPISMPSETLLMVSVRVSVPSRVVGWLMISMLMVWVPDSVKEKTPDSLPTIL